MKAVNAFHGGKGSYMVAEFYPGWLMHWGERFPATPAEKLLPAFDSLLARGASVSLYMFHGGTNFGFTSGANYSKELPIEPSLPSYDYDAPLTEAGWPAPKYYALRDVIRRHVSYAIPDVPDRLPVITTPAIRLEPVETVFDLVSRVKSVTSPEPLSFEALGQASGYVLYRHRFDRATSGTLDVAGLRDYGLVFVDGKRVAILSRRERTYTAPIAGPAGGRLDILVENVGRINYGAELATDWKGIIAPVRLDSAELTRWAMYGLPFDHQPDAEHASADAPSSGVPAVYRGRFVRDRTGDTFLDLRGWGKGIVFVNGINLGRYWRIGPQQTLYLPGAWLHRGENEIVVFEMWNDQPAATIAGLDRSILTELHPTASATAAGSGQ